MKIFHTSNLRKEETIAVEEEMEIQEAVKEGEVVIAVTITVIVVTIAAMVE